MKLVYYIGNASMYFDLYLLNISKETNNTPIDYHLYPSALCLWLDIGHCL